MKELEKFFFNKETHPLPDVTASRVRVQIKQPVSPVAEKPDLTVITVVFNALKGAGEAALKECLDSVQAQEGVVIEHLIIDGNSTDGTVDYLRSYTPTRHLIRLLSEPDKGIYDAMNKGVALADGDYSFFLNSDDFLHNPHGMAASIKRLRETGCDFSYAPVLVLKNGKPFPQALHCRADARLIFCSMPFSHQSVVATTHCLRAVNGYDNIRYRSSADYDMLLRMVFAGFKACFVDCVFSTFRIGGFSSINLETSQKECGQIYARLFSEVTGFPITPEASLRMFCEKIVPRGLKAALMPYYFRSFNEFVTPQAPIAKPAARVMTVVLEPRVKRNLADDWVESIDPVWEQEELCERVRKLPPQTEVTGSDYWHLFSPYLYNKEGAWCDGRLGVVFRLPETQCGKDLSLTLGVVPFYRPDMPHMRLSLAVNGKLFADTAIDRGVFASCTVAVPAEITREGVLAIEVHSGDRNCPSNVRNSTDTRVQGFLFNFVKVEVSR